MVNETWGFVLIVGFWGWVACSIGFIVKSFPQRDSFSGAAARLWGSGVIIFYCLWIAGMMNA